jgi:hypothetical protein
MARASSMEAAVSNWTVSPKEKLPPLSNAL